MTLDEPYFMKNKEWYYFDEESFMYKLTDKATEEAKKSYTDFYETLDRLHDEDIRVETAQPK